MSYIIFVRGTLDRVSNHLGSDINGVRPYVFLEIKSKPMELLQKCKWELYFQKGDVRKKERKKKNPFGMQHDTLLEVMVVIFSFLRGRWQKNLCRNSKDTLCSHSSVAWVLMVIQCGIHSLHSRYSLVYYKFPYSFQDRIQWRIKRYLKEGTKVRKSNRWQKLTWNQQFDVW